MSDQIMDDHRKMVAMTGNISDFQLQQLKNWPYVVIDKKYVDNVYLNYDFTDKDEEGREGLCAGTVTYDFQIKGDPPYSESELEKRLGHLIMWTKNLFWDDTVVEIKKKGKPWLK